jgi:curved DNA-binding protein CbpA
MSFQIQRGFFALDFTDHYAILGIAIDTETKDLRKRYLKVARRLHPDSCSAESEADKQIAEQLLSKLVNPAWEGLAQEKARTEYDVLLKLKAQGAAQQGSVEVAGALAQQLQTATNPDHFYQTALQELVDRQYQQLDQALEITAQLSELNLVYAIRKNGKNIGGGARKPVTTSGASAGTGNAAQPKAAPPKESLVDQYYRRAEGFAAKGNFTQATLELRDALKIEPNNSRCHSLMGTVYLKQNQPTMAKIHFNKALEINPNDEAAKEGKQKLEQTNKTTSQTTAKPAKKDDRSQSSGGLFGGLFGKKK